MTTTLIEQLNRLAEAAPEVCRIKSYSDGDSFIIGEYAFWQNYNNFFAKTLGEQVRNRAALAWLRDAIEAAIEARGWSLEVKYNGRMHICQIVGDSKIVYQSRWKSSATAALLAALIAAVEER